MRDRVFIISFLIAVVTLIGSTTFYKYNELLSIKANVDAAIAKGIDPIAVRCAYSRETDLVCVAHGTAQGNLQKPTK